MKKTDRKNISIILLLILICVINMAGCFSEKNDNDSEVVDIDKNDRSDNPFDLNDSELDNGQIQASYGWGINNYDSNIREIKLDGEELVLEIEFENSYSSCEIGMVFIIDGIIQLNELDGKKDYVNSVRLNEESKQSFNYKILPQYGISGNEHELLLGCIYEPNYKCDDEKNYFDGSHRMNTTLPWKILHNVEENEVCKTVTKQIDNNQYTEIDNDFVKRDAFSYENTLSNDVVDDVSKLQYLVTDLENSSYRLIYLLNNQPIMTEEIQIDNGKMYKKNMDFLKKYKYENYTNLSVILCPYNNGIYNDNDMLDISSTVSLKRGAK